MMKLTEFLRLNQKQQDLERELVAFSQTNPSAEAVQEKIFAYDLPSLFKIAFNNSKVDKLLKSEPLKAYWEDQWRRAGVNPRGCKYDRSKPLHEYWPMPTISTFTLLQGLFIYTEYQHIMDSKKMSLDLVYIAAEYLILAAQSGNFFAMNALCEQGLKLLKPTFNDDLARLILKTAQQAAKLYWTPGYLLLANVYKEFNKHKEEEILKAMNLPLNAYEALRTAQGLEPKSVVMINNAYQGKTIIEASAGAIKSFLQIKMKFVADLNLTATDCSLAERKAELALRDINKKFPEAALPIEHAEIVDVDFDSIPTF
ncbi:DUF5630 domain-containing protein [Legionella sp. km772]|uniref:DUF5630 domain-containing protein n=1 Tax=Legionella sp. km772 TaxID=2498111 RepID=UPI000F8EC1BE|nr:DUF5630 domain-containing protein [Legionella sp. km772]RUR08414.1 hypothetical protein ELY15_10935 [Legionella sp. km772]